MSISCLRPLKDFSATLRNQNAEEPLKMVMVRGEGEERGRQAGIHLKHRRYASHDTLGSEGGGSKVHLQYKYVRIHFPKWFSRHTLRFPLFPTVRRYSVCLCDFFRFVSSLHFSLVLYSLACVIEDLLFNLFSTLWYTC